MAAKKQYYIEVEKFQFKYLLFALISAVAFVYFVVILTIVDSFVPDIIISSLHIVTIFLISLSAVSGVFMLISFFVEKKKIKLNVYSRRLDKYE